MSIQKLTNSYAAYNVWANEQYVNWLQQKPEAELQQEVPSSFSGILKTLNHIWAIEEYWYSILTGSSEFVNRYFVEEYKSDEIFKGLIDRSKALAEKIGTFTEAELTEKLKVVSPWFETEQARYEYIQHLFNHSTYHRGQLVTIARNTGITDAPATDYLFFNVAKQYQS